MSWTFKMPERLVQIDVDPGRMGLNYPVEVGLNGDAKAVLGDLLSLIPTGRAGSELLNMVAQLKRQNAEDVEEFMSNPPAVPLHPLWVTTTLRNKLPRNAIFTSDGSMTEGWLLEQSFRYYEPRCVLIPVISQTMGYSLPAAIGAKLACPERPVVCLSGDGSIQMSLTELATARNYGAAVIIIVFNDGFYNALRFHQKYYYDERYMGVELHDPDFAGIAECYGIRGYRVRKPEEFVDALDSALASGHPCLLDVAIDPDGLSRRWQERRERALKAKQVAVGVGARSGA